MLTRPAGSPKPAKLMRRRRALEPSSDEALARLAWLTLLGGHPDRAIDLAQKAIAINPSAMNLGILAMAQDWNNQIDDAIKTALKAVDKDPLLAEAHAFLAEVYADKNNWARALEEAQTAVKLNSKSAIAQRNLGYVLENQGRRQAAIEAYLKAAELEPKLGYIYMGIGSSYMAMGDSENALAYFQKAVEANPDIPTGYDAFGAAAGLTGDPDRALANLRKATEIDPTYGCGLRPHGSCVLHTAQLGSVDRVLHQGHRARREERRVLL